MTDEIRIGPVELLDEIPTVVALDGGRFILSRDEDDDPVLFSAVCPHQGGRVTVADESTLRCPTHRWEFDAASGSCIRRGDEPLTAYDVRVADGDLLADLG